MPLHMKSHMKRFILVKMAVDRLDRNCNGSSVYLLTRPGNMHSRGAQGPCINRDLNSLEP